MRTRLDQLITQNVLFYSMVRMSVTKEGPSVAVPHQAEASSPVQIDWIKVYHSTEFLSGLQTAIAQILDQPRLSAPTSNRKVNHWAQLEELTK